MAEIIRILLILTSLLAMPVIVMGMPTGIVLLILSRENKKLFKIGLGLFLLGPGMLVLTAVAWAIMTFIRTYFGISTISTP